MKLHDTIDGRLLALIERSKVMFVGSAPANGKHVNVSPKGMDGTFKVTGPTEVVYLDTPGSGCETLAHIRENGRVVFMFCAFDGDPMIVRVFGRGTAALRGTPAFDEQVAKYFNGLETPAMPKRLYRSVITVTAFTIQSACGYGVPRMRYQEDRETLPKHYLAREGDEAYLQKLRGYGYTLDGLAGAGIGADASLVQWRSHRPGVVASGWLSSNYQGILVGMTVAGVAYWVAGRRH
ncbi:Pyridoxamine 5prime-phosphate oxidase family protein [Diplonema papillatum]|nr:Pyridoxamine 5prime-phosphate oxidase family protein [Diplonema papillatum]